jgi:hypothetical protein
MVRNTLSALAALALLATPALATRCPADAAAIEHALTTTSLSDEEKAELRPCGNF